MPSSNPFAGGPGPSMVRVRLRAAGQVIGRSRARLSPSSGRYGPTLPTTGEEPCRRMGTEKSRLSGMCRPDAQPDTGAAPTKSLEGDAPHGLHRLQEPPVHRPDPRALEEVPRDQRLGAPR